MDRRLSSVSLFCLILFALFFELFMPCRGIAQTADQARRGSILNGIPQDLLNRLAAGKPQEVIVEFDSAEVESEASTLRSQRGLRYDDRQISEFKAQHFRQIKDRVFAQLPAAEVEVLMDYNHLPMALLRLPTASLLGRLVDLPQVVAIYENWTIYPDVAKNLQLINQPQAASAGYTGVGTTVAVLDTGVNYMVDDFGSCTAPGVPAGCKVIACVDLTGNNNCLDSMGHGTNVAGIVVAVAPGSNIAALKVFNPDGTSTDALVIAGINWVISNRSAYNIVAINMSLGDGSDNTSPCSNRHTNPFLTPVNNARGAGILPVASSGNNNYIDGIGSPACTPGVISVGAVYDANIGGVSYGICTDATTAPDQITCFSNSASFLTMLAPGAAISAGGYTLYGTSQAAPHVAGAVAVLRAAYPSETIDSTAGRLSANGRPVTDPRNGVTTPRLDVYAALGIAVPAFSGYGLWGAFISLILLGATAIHKQQSKGKSSICQTKPLSFHPKEKTGPLER